MDSGYKDRIAHKLFAITGRMNFSNQCLPVSLESLSYIKKTYPAARVVIGITSFKGKIEGDGEHLQAFVNEETVDFIPPYHAWIDLGNDDILDLTWCATKLGSDGQSLDKNDAAELGLIHTAILTEESEINRFNDRIMNTNTSGFNHSIPQKYRKAYVESVKSSSIRAFFEKLILRVRKFFGSI